MRIGKLSIVGFITVLLTGAGSWARASGQAGPELVHSPAATFVRTEPLVLRAATQIPLEWILCFWKLEGSEDFDSLAFEAQPDGSFTARLETGTIASAFFSYYIAYKSGGQVRYVPEKIPDGAFIVRDTTPAGAKPAEPAAAAEPETARKAAFPLRLDGSAETVLVQSEGGSAATGISLAENLSLNYRSRTEGLSLELAARLSYTNQPLSGENGIDLPGLSLAAIHKGHTFRAGDLAIAESEFTVGASGRRGLEYLFDNRNLYLHLFTASTQQLRGFKGVGLPKAGASFLGGATGFKLGETLTLKAIFISGEDDPALGFNVGTSSLVHRRKGRVLAVVGESRLFAKAFQLRAEFASSDYDGDVSDAEASAKGIAYSVRSRFQKGVLDVQAGYRLIGKNYNTVGQPFFLNDRRGFDAGLGLSFGRIRLSGLVREDRNNVDDDPELATARLGERRADFSWNFGGTSSLRLGYTFERQDASFPSGLWNPYSAFQGKLDKQGLSAGLDVGFTPQVRLSVSGEQASLRSADTPAMEGSQMALRAGLQVMIPERLSLFPSLSYSLVKQYLAGTETKMFLASLNGEATLVRKWLTWNAVGTVGSSDSGPGSTVALASVDTGLNLNVRPLVRFGDVIASLRGGYVRSGMAGQTSSQTRLVFRLTHSF